LHRWPHWPIVLPPVIAIVVVWGVRVVHWGVMVIHVGHVGRVGRKWGIVGEVLLWELLVVHGGCSRLRTVLVGHLLKLVLQDGHLLS
jgi:hypothetical protein